MQFEPPMDPGREVAVGWSWSFADAGGDRDRGKRPAMGAIASQLADEVVLTTGQPA